MKRLLGKWWSDWAGIDLVVLGVAIVNVATYLSFRYSYPTNNEPWLDLWSSVTTDLFFAWITIRIIDVLIGRRDHREGVRRTLVGNLNYTLSIIQILLPKVYQSDVERLRNELYWAQRRYPSRKHFLKQGESSKLEGAHAALHRLIQEADKLPLARQHEAKCQREIQGKIKELNTLRNKFESDLRKVQKEIAVGRQKDGIVKAREMIQSNQTILSGHEVLELEHRLVELEEQIVGPDDDYRHIEWPQINTIFETDVVNAEFQQILRDLQDFSGQDYTHLVQRLQASRTREKTAYPSVVLHGLLQEWHDAVEAIIQIYEKVEQYSKKAVETLSIARDDILEETAFD